MKCRLCILECSNIDAISIFNEEEESNLAKLIVKYLYLEITKYDEFSTKICFDCKRYLQAFDEFFERVEQCQRKLKADYTEQPKEIPYDTIEAKRKNSKHIDESLIVLDEIEIENLNSTLPETEEFEFADDKSENGSNFSNIEPKVEAAKRKKCKIHISKAKDISPKAMQKRRGRPRKEKTIDSEIITDVEKNSSDKTNAELNLKKERKTEVKRLLSPAEEKEKDDFIAKNMELKCEICGEIMLAFKKFRSHFIKRHQQRAYITCCGLRLTQRWRLINHIRLHVDPNHFKCKYCEKVLTTQLGYEMHLSNYHGDQEEKKHECEICHKRFSLKISLKAHMIVHKREANLPCEFCKKRFKTINALKKHTEFMHGEKTTFICHICGKDFKSKHNLETHIVDVHTGIPKSKCSVCDKWVSSCYLKKHEEYHIPKEVECDECGKTFPSEGSLRGHKRGFAHKERTLNCSYCEKTFKERRFLKEHIAIHLGRKDHFCKYCLREFRSQSNMRKHIRQQHVAEYGEEQNRKRLGNSVENTNALLITESK